MGIIFVLIAIVITVITIYGIGRMQYSHNALLRTYKNRDFLGAFHLMLGMILTVVLFITLCAINNTFWQLSY